MTIHEAVSNQPSVEYILFHGAQHLYAIYLPYVKLRLKVQSYAIALQAKVNVFVCF